MLFAAVQGGLCAADIVTKRRPCAFWPCLAETGRIYNRYYVKTENGGPGGGRVLAGAVDRGAGQAGSAAAAARQSRG